jgi:hypothetical protein
MDAELANLHVVDIGGNGAERVDPESTFKIFMEESTIEQSTV